MAAILFADGGDRDRDLRRRAGGVDHRHRRRNRRRDLAAARQIDELVIGLRIGGDVLPAAGGVGGRVDRRLEGETDLQLRGLARTVEHTVEGQIGQLARADQRIDILQRGRRHRRRDRPPFVAEDVGPGEPERDGRADRGVGIERCRGHRWRRIDRAADQREHVPVAPAVGAVGIERSEYRLQSGLRQHGAVDRHALGGDQVVELVE